MLYFKQIARLAGLLLAWMVTTGAAIDQAAAKSTSGLWVLDRGHEFPSPVPKRPTLRMTGQGLSGSTGCNEFTATLSQKGEKRIAIEDLSQTRKLCGPKESEVEAAFVRALSQTEYLRSEHGRLTFLSGKRETLLVWKRADPNARSHPTRRKFVHRRTRRAIHFARWCGW
jgi:heat shock protein HslJ